jgi:hypothetical protein
MEATGPWVKVDRAGSPVGKGLTVLAGADGIFGSRIDLRAEAD